MKIRGFRLVCAKFLFKELGCGCSGHISKTGNEKLLKMKESMFPLYIP